MRYGQRVLSVIAVFMVAALTACSNSPKKPIAVTLSGTPPASMAEGAAVAFTANVANDSANAGVTWTVTCGSAACGSFSSSSTASGVATTYTAPATIPSGGSVTVTATSVTDTTKSAPATITITAASSLADGTYVFSLSGQDVAGAFVYFVAGAFKVASGAITGGEQDFVDYNLASTQNDTIGSGSVSTTADGNIQVVLNTGDPAIGVAGTETLNGTLVNGGRALITEFDASATSSGQLDLQTATSAGQGGFAFFLTGGDSSGLPANLGGVVNVTGSGAISGAGSVFDINDAGTVLQNQPIDPSTLSAPDSFGRITISLNLSTSGVGGIGLVAYVVDNSRVRLVENSNDPNDAFFGVTGGTAFAQGSNAGGFSAASVQGSSFVFGLNGQEPSGYLQVAGVLAMGANGAVTGKINFNDLTGTGVQAPVTVQGTYTVDTTGRATIVLGIAGGTAKLQAYLDGNGHAGLVSMGASDVLAGYVYQQTGGGSFTAGSFNGSYGLNATGYGSATGPELDAVGPVASDGVSTLNGTIDLNALNVGQTPGITLTDGFSAVDPSGIFTGTITGLDLLAGSQDAYAYYLVDTTKVVAIETDPNQMTLGYFELQQ